MYFPTRDIKPLAEYKLNNTTEEFIKSKDGTDIQVWYHPSPTGKMAIFLHGNSGNLGRRSEKFRVLSSLGYGFIAPAWRGFGESSSKPTKKGLYQDAEASINFAISKGYRTENIVLIGESLGSGIASKMATKYQFKGLFLITPYTKIADRAQEIFFYLPAKYLLKDNFNNIDNIKKIKTPLFIIHGDEDDVIPHHHSEKIFAVANDPKKLIIYPGINHSNYSDLVVFAEMNDFFYG